MDILVKRRKAESPFPEPSRKPTQPPPYGKRYGEWGRVDLLHSEDNSVDVFLDIGVYLKRVPVSSSEWVVPGGDSGKEYTSGERSLPPVNARVFIMMPAGTFDGCFIAPFSGFSTIDQTRPYMEEDKEKIKERITPSGWHTVDDNTTGSHRAVSPDGKTSLEIDYGAEEEPKDKPELHLDLFGDLQADVISNSNVKLNVFREASIEHKKGGGIVIKAYDTEVSINNGSLRIKTTKKTVTTQDIDIISVAPIGMNLGLYKTGLGPYLKVETAALTALAQAASQAAAQLAILDAVSGGTGFITALGAAIAAYCAAMLAADAAADAAIALVAK
jgi:hypothetical protein